MLQDVSQLEDDALERLILRELEADEIALLLNQAKEYRSETLCAIRLQKLDPFACSACFSYYTPTLRTEQGDRVCTGCGLVVAEHCVDNTWEDYRRSHNTYPGYKHIFHFNERVANLACDDPTIPSDVFALVELVYGAACTLRGGTCPLWYDDVRRILRSVMVPDGTNGTEDLQEKYRGKRYKKLPLTNLDQKFSERWLTIRFRLTGERPPPIPAKVRRGIQLLFLGILSPFSKVRHKPECTRCNKCHKIFGCSYKLPPYNFIIKELLYVHGGRDLMNTYGRYLLHTNSAASLQKIRGQWDQICEANRWIASYLPNADEIRPMDLAKEV